MFKNGKKESNGITGKYKSLSLPPLKLSTIADADKENEIKNGNDNNLSVLEKSDIELCTQAFEDDEYQKVSSPQVKNIRQCVQDSTKKKKKIDHDDDDDDDIYHFLKSIENPLRNLSPDQQMHARYKIQKILSEEMSSQTKSKEKKFKKNM